MVITARGMRRMRSRKFIMTVLRAGWRRLIGSGVDRGVVSLGIDNLAGLDEFLSDRDHVDLERQADHPNAVTRVLDDGHRVERHFIAVLDGADAQHAVIVERQHRLRQHHHRRRADIHRRVGGDAVEQFAVRVRAFDFDRERAGLRRRR